MKLKEYKNSTYSSTTSSLFGGKTPKFLSEILFSNNDNIKFDINTETDEIILGSDILTLYPKVV